MKNLLSLPYLFILLLFGFSSCYQAPEFPVEPSIGYENLEFYDTPNQDSLVLTINFEDGDGDLGIWGNEIDRPYHPFSFVDGGSGNPLTISSNDTMPPYTPPYSCVNYKLGKISNGGFIYYSSDAASTYQKTFADNLPDTLYSRPNIYTDNFLVDFMVKRGESYEEFSWITAPSSGCGESMNGRFTPLFNSDNPDKPLSGEITYSMENFGFIPYFRNDTVKLSVRIIDRSLNVSNRVETPAFYFTRESDRYQISFVE